MRNLPFRNRKLLTIVLSCMFLMAFGVDAQAQSVSGVVRSAADNQPLPGVTVQVKGTSNSTTTDAKGTYIIRNVSSADSLFFTSIGFLGETLAVDSRTEISMLLKVEASSLDQVVVVGYGTQKKRDLTGSIKTINMGDLPPGSNTNLMQALRGYASGLNVQGGGSLAGDEPQLSVRGQTSLSASDRPLIVLDGIIFQGSINDINVADVERIDVLKDASAAAVYGSRSANGVLIITTKNGKGTKPSININSYYGLQDFSNHPVKMMSAKQYATRLVDYNYEQLLYRWYAKNPNGSTDQGGKPIRPDINNPNIVIPFLRSQDEVNNYRAGREVDWIDEVTQVAPLQNYDLNISGASARSTYYISGSYTDQKGLLINDQFKRTILSAKVETKVTDWITLGLNTSHSKRDQSGLATTLEYARNASPLASKYDSSGNYPVDFNGEFLMRHPLRNTLVDNKDYITNLFTTAYAKFQIPQINGLTYDFNYSNNSITANNNTFIPSTVFEGQATRGQATIENSKETSWII
ncbi:MAG: TonB-dependent receptor plug domain-containing protein, partial [Chitinophagaceae bacterium]